MIYKAKPIFRIKVEEQYSGKKLYYPQLSNTTIGIFRKRYWKSISAVDKNGNFTDDINSLYKTINRTYGFTNINAAKKVIHLWKSRLTNERLNEIKYIDYINVN